MAQRVRCLFLWSVYCSKKCRREMVVYCGTGSHCL